jgi:hypothetical protein
MGTHFCAFKGLSPNTLMVFGGNTFIKSEEVSSFSKKYPKKNRMYWRHPKTTAERRASVALRRDEDALLYGVRPRGSRGNMFGLPSDREDRHVSSRTDRSWKRFRHFQWR